MLTDRILVSDVHPPATKSHACVQLMSNENWQKCQCAACHRSYMTALFHWSVTAFALMLLRHICPHILYLNGAQCEVSAPCSFCKSLFFSWCYVSAMNQNTWTQSLSIKWILPDKDMIWGWNIVQGKPICCCHFFLIFTQSSLWTDGCNRFP